MTSSFFPSSLKTSKKQDQIISDDALELAKPKQAAKVIKEASGPVKPKKVAKVVKDDRDEVIINR